MPVIQSSASNVVYVSDVSALAAAMMNDATQSQFSNAYLLPFIQSAYRRLQKDLGTHGMKGLIGMAVVTLPAGGKNLMDSPLGLDIKWPDDFLYPHRLRERVSGQTSQLFADVKETPQGLPQKSALGQTLDYWEFTEDMIMTSGATNDVDIELRYARGYTLPRQQTDALQIKDCLDAIASLAAAKVARSRGAKAMAGDMAGQYDEELYLLRQAINRPKQRTGVRRRPYGARHRSSLRYP